MPSTINIQTLFQNAQFQQFVQFAEGAVAAGKEKAVARLSESELGGIVNRTIKPTSADWVGIGVGRLASLKRANNITREAFMNAVGNMFGGVDHIPDNVKDAMKMQDYGKGKPLTARRILAVKAAIDAVKLTTFQSADTERIALNMGFVKSEFPKLARAAHFYAQAAGLSELDALKAVAEPNSKPNRLLQYGGRFLDNAENFANGLRLIDSFKDWFTGVRETKNADGNSFANAHTFTDLNINSELATKDSTAAFERFVFEELAVNGAHDLSGTDPEKLFGVENNAAMRFFATDRCYNFIGVVANVPPERRGAIYAVLDKLSLPLAKTKDEALSRNDMSRAERSVHNPHIVIGRILRHLPEIERLASKGSLTEKNIVKTLFPDLPTPNWTRAAVNEFTHYVDWSARDILMAADKDLDEAEATSAGGKIQLIMEETCCTLQEGIAAYKKGKRVAPPQYMTTATFSMEKLDGTTTAARDQLDGNKMGDLWRPYNYGAADDPENKGKFFITNAADLAFGFTFPDGTSLKANAVQHAGNIPTIVAKLESLAGKVHPRQQSALLFAVSQSGIGVLKGGLEPYGISGSEHAAVNFTLSRDDATGAITVKYESPEKLPVYFSWTATIDVDGNMTSTPLEVMDQASVAACKAGADKAIAAMKGPTGTHNQQFVLDKDRAEPLVGTMMRASGGDPDTIGLLTDPFVCTGLLYNNQNQLRSPEVIQSRVAALKENVAELREATKGDEQMWKMGMIGLAALGGKPVPKGALAALVKAVRSVDVGKLKNLSVAADTPLKMHAAIAQFHRAVTLAREKSGINAMVKGGEEDFGVRTLVGRLLAARFGEDALRTMKGALESPVAGRLMAIYEELQDVPIDRNLLKGYEADIVRDKGPELSSDVTSLLDSVNEALDVKKSLPPRFKGNAQELDGFEEICFDVIDLTKNLHADEIERHRQKLEQQMAQNRAAENARQNGNAVIAP